MEHKSDDGHMLPTPEVLAGQELRRLRRERGWSQEEVARRMGTYGFDSWHQTTVGRTETATRPLRLNEAVALAALFTVPVTQLLVPVPLRVADIDEEIELTRRQQAELRSQVDEIRPRIEEAETAVQTVQATYRKAADALEWADTHLEMLRGIRSILTSGSDIAAETIAMVTGAHELVRRRDTPEDGQ